MRRERNSIDKKISFIPGDYHHGQRPITSSTQTNVQDKPTDVVVGAVRNADRKEQP